MQIILTRGWFPAFICNGLSKECNDVKKSIMETNTPITLYAVRMPWDEETETRTESRRHAQNLKALTLKISAL